MDFLLNAEELPALEIYLRERKWIAPDEELKSASIPGAGNMNYTLRLKTSFRSFIIKQSRDYVEKYPQVPAPPERAVIEGQFYELIQQHDELRPFIPEVNHIDDVNNIITLEDLGESSDFLFLYERGKNIEAEAVSGLMKFLSVLHRDFREGLVETRIKNPRMRALNAEHIFQYPFLLENGFDLDAITPGLQEVSLKYKGDDDLKAQVKILSQAYLADGPVLQHGDFYPGSWLGALNGIKVIDPEFGFFGPAEFDLSVMRAHFIMAEQSEAILSQVEQEYASGIALDKVLLDALTGVEIMRRVIGLAQLPLVQNLGEKARLLEQAYEMIMGKS